MYNKCCVVSFVAFTSVKVKQLINSFVLDRSTELYLSAIWECLFKISTIFVHDFQSRVHVRKTWSLIFAGHNHSLWIETKIFLTLIFVDINFVEFLKIKILMMHTHVNNDALPNWDLALPYHCTLSINYICFSTSITRFDPSWICWKLCLEK